MWKTDIHGNRNLYAECIFFLWKYSVTGTGGADFESDGQIMTQIAGGMEQVMTQTMRQLGENLQNAFSIDADAFTGAI